MKLSRTIVLVVAVLSLVSAALGDQKLTADELIARHLDSIGTADARKAIKSRMVRADVDMSYVTGPARHATGQAMVVSLGRQYSFQIKSQDADFANEQFVFDGSKVNIGLIAPNTRSVLGRWLYTHDVLVSESLVGGTLSTGWALLDAKSRNSKLSYNGLKTVDGRQLHELAYAPKKADRDLQIRLYFDPETFRHVKSVYSFVVSASMDHDPVKSKDPTRSGLDRTETRYTLEENFSEFQSRNGVTVPAKWEMRYTYQGQTTATRVYDFTVNGLAHNNVTD